MATAAKKEQFPVPSFSVKLFLITVLACALAAAFRPGAPQRASAAAPDPSCGLQYAGSIGGRAYDIVTAGSRGYVGEAHSFTILDIAAIPDTRVLARLPMAATVYDVEVAGSTAFLAVGT